jgi:hypothetical protein
MSCYIEHGAIKKRRKKRRKRRKPHNDKHIHRYFIVFANTHREKRRKKGTQNI